MPPIIWAGISVLLSAAAVAVSIASVCAAYRRYREGRDFKYFKMGWSAREEGEIEGETGEHQGVAAMAGKEPETPAPTEKAS